MIFQFGTHCLRFASSFIVLRKVGPQKGLTDGKRPLEEMWSFQKEEILFLKPIETCGLETTAIVWMGEEKCTEKMKKQTEWFCRLKKSEIERLLYGRTSTSAILIQGLQSFQSSTWTNRMIFRKNRRVPSKETRIKCIYCEIKTDHCMEQREKDVKELKFRWHWQSRLFWDLDGCLQWDRIKIDS